MSDIKIVSVLKGVGALLLVIIAVKIMGSFSSSVGSVDENNISIPTVFLTGLVTGGLTCLALQGGLLASAISRRGESGQPVNPSVSVLLFLIAKLIVYTMLGFALGALGSVFELSLTTRIIIQFAVILFMFATAGNLLNLHPIFRFAVITPPRFLTKRIRKESKSASFFAPLLLGGMTVFIPCATTQAMIALSVISGSAIMGALIMFFFTLGTSPLFFILGFTASKIGEGTQKRFYKFAGVGILILALFNLDNTLALANSPFTISGAWSQIKSAVQLSKPDEIDANTVNASTMQIIFFEETQYSPSVVYVPKGKSVSLQLENRAGSGCIQAFTIPSLGYQEIIPVGQSKVFSFVAPDIPTDIPFMCGMGMYRGVIKVI